jgi:hypothetical protein
MLPAAAQAATGSSRAGTGSCVIADPANPNNVIWDLGRAPYDSEASSREASHRRFRSLSLALFSQSLRSIPFGTAYAIWTGTGAAGSILAGVVLFGESAGVFCFTCLILIVRIASPQFKLIASRNRCLQPLLPPVPLMPTRTTGRFARRSPNPNFAVETGLPAWVRRIRTRKCHFE